jgi:drug/metabolite transporter (DMT)-like permease
LTRHTYLDRTAVITMAVLCLLWGYQQVTVKLAMEGISPVMQSGLRSIIAALLLWIWMRFHSIRVLNGDRSWIPGLCAGFLFALEFGLLYWGLHYTNVSRAIIFLYTSPFVVALGIHFLLPSERLNAWQGIGLLIAFAGIAIIFGDWQAAGSPDTWRGDALVLLGAIAWGATTLWIRLSSLVQIDPSRALFYQLAVSALLLPLFSLALGEPGVVQLTPLVVACILFQGVVVAFASYLVWFWLVSKYPVSQLAGFSFLAPFFGVVFGVLFLDDPLTVKLIAGGVLVGAGIYLVSTRKPAPT